MAADERDAMFEKALARQLRGGASEDLRNGAAGQDCPDAEILSGYHERTLSAGEMAECARHIGGCARCQEILSLLEATEGIPLDARVSEDGSAESARDTAARAIVMRAPKHFAGRRLGYWIAPVGAMAAVLLLWIAVKRPKEGNEFQKGSAEIAMNRENAPLPQTKPPGELRERDEYAGEAAKLTPPLREEFQAQKKEAASGSEGALVAKDFPKSSANLAAPRVVAPAAKAEGVARGIGSGNGVAGGIGGGAGTGAGDVTAKNAPSPAMAPPVTTQSIEVTEAAPVVSSEVSAPAKPPANGSVDAKAKERTADTLSVQSLPMNGRDVMDLLMLEKGVLQPMIAAPDGEILWRVGRAGSIETSKDGGAHWKKQKSHVKVELLTGAAASGEICWVVGSAGTILRTVDGGGHWKRVTSPMAGDIAGVSATDAEHATVWDANKSSTFVTADGGVTWTAVTKK